MKKAIMFLMAMSAFDSVLATGSSQNLIVNGNFAENQCRNDWCIFRGQNDVRGWIPEPQIEIGFGHVYNSNLGRQRVLELAPNSNSCVRQTVRSLRPGIYELSFQYTARNGRSFDDCQFSVSFNGRSLKTVKPNDFRVRSDSIDIEVREGCDGDIRFCGVGGPHNNSFGAILRSVRMVRKGDLPVVRPPPVVNPPVVNPPVTQPPIVHPPVVLPPVVLPPVIQPPIVHPPILNPPILNPPTPLPPIINPPVSNSPAFSLDSHSGRCFQRQYQLQGGLVEISFDYRIVANLPVKDSAIFITLKGNPIYKVLPCDSGKNLKVQGQLNKGLHIFGFCAVGSPNDIPHQAHISNVVVCQKQCVAGWGNDLIVNGGFEENQCKNHWCIWNQQTGLNAVTAWIPSPEIQVGRGTVYNAALGNSWVSELDPKTNSCIRQKLALKPGKYSLNFDWASRSGTKFASSPFEVKVNGQCIKTIQADDCQVHKESIEFTLSSCPAESWIEFCGTGTSDSFGALIDNVKLFGYDQCATTKIVRY